MEYDEPDRTMEERNRETLGRIHGYSDEALARLVVAKRATEITESAIDIAGFAAGADVLSLVEMADQLRREADRLVEQAVIAARAAGHSWTEIGAYWGITKQGASSRFKETEEHWEQALVQPYTTSGEYAVSVLPEAVSDPGATVEYLEQWLAEARVPLRSATWDQPREVAAALPERDRAAQRRDLMRRIGVMAKRRLDDDERLPESVEADYRARKLEVDIDPDAGAPLGSDQQIDTGGEDHS